MNIKIVVNNCYGGFSLSPAAMSAILLSKRVEFFRSEGGSFYVLDRADRKRYIHPEDFDRSDPDLVAVVEQLGAAANGRSADLRIVEIPKGTRYRIESYDGLERIEFESSIAWSTA